MAGAGAAAGRLRELLAEVCACRACEAVLPLGPRPVLQAGRGARILIASQAPGRKVHESGVPFDDASGERLRDWLGVTRAQFYDPALFAILPMGFCYPGHGAGGDLPPRRECAPLWRARLLAELPRIEFTLLVGRYAIEAQLGCGVSVSAAVAAWREHGPRVLPLPHPSPCNNRWLREHAWFEAEVLPALRDRVRRMLA